MTLTVDEFAALFQVSNHLNDLVDLDFADVDLSSQQVGELVETLRAIDHLVDGSVSRIQIPFSETSEHLSTFTRSGSEIVLEMGARVARDWRRLVLATADGLDPRELLLRTGYRADEIHSAARGLDAIESS